MKFPIKESYNKKRKLFIQSRTKIEEGGSINRILHLKNKWTLKL